MWRDTWELSSLGTQFKVCHWTSSLFPCLHQTPVEAPASPALPQARRQPCPKSKARDGDLLWFSRICRDQMDQVPAKNGNTQTPLSPFYLLKLADTEWQKPSENVKTEHVNVAVFAVENEKHLRSICRTCVKLSIYVAWAFVRTSPLHNHQVSRLWEIQVVVIATWIVTLDLGKS